MIGVPAKEEDQLNPTVAMWQSIVGNYLKVVLQITGLKAQVQALRRDGRGKE
jgi:hypothetical protein